jgi:hypothetical protein
MSRKKLLLYLWQRNVFDILAYRFYNRGSFTIYSKHEQQTEYLTINWEAIYKVPTNHSSFLVSKLKAKTDNAQYFY